MGKFNYNILGSRNFFAGIGLLWYLGQTNLGVMLGFGKKDFKIQQVLFIKMKQKWNPYADKDSHLFEQKESVIDSVRNIKILSKSKIFNGKVYFS